MPTAMLKPCRDSRCVNALFRRPTGLADGLALKELALPPTPGEDSPQPLVPPLPPVRPGGLGRLAIGREYTPRPDVFMRVSSRPRGRSRALQRPSQVVAPRRLCQDSRPRYHAGADAGSAPANLVRAATRP